MQRIGKRVTKFFQNLKCRQNSKFEPLLATRDDSFDSFFDAFFTIQKTLLHTLRSTDDKNVEIRVVRGWRAHVEKNNSMNKSVATQRRIMGESRRLLESTITDECEQFLS
jgi:hypothetical protein